MSTLIFSIIGLACSTISLCVAIPFYIRTKNLRKKLNNSQQMVPLEERKLLTHDEHADITLTADDDSIVEIHYVNYYSYWLDEFGNEIRDAEDPFSRTSVEIVRAKGDKVLYRFSRNVDIDP